MLIDTNINLGDIFGANFKAKAFGQSIFQKADATESGEADNSASQDVNTDQGGDSTVEIDLGVDVGTTLAPDAGATIVDIGIEAVAAVDAEVAGGAQNLDQDAEAVGMDSDADNVAEQTADVDQEGTALVDIDVNVETTLVPQFGGIFIDVQLGEIGAFNLNFSGAFQDLDQDAFAGSSGTVTNTATQNTSSDQSGDATTSINIDVSA